MFRSTSTAHSAAARGKGGPCRPHHGWSRQHTVHHRTAGGNVVQRGIQRPGSDAFQQPASGAADKASLQPAEPGGQEGAGALGEVQAEHGWEAALVAASQWTTQLFPVWVVLAAGLALLHPPLFTWLPTSAITSGLALTMLGMGLTMKVADFTAVFQRMPGLLLLGMVLQYSVMPALGFVFSRFAGLEPPLAVGIALLSACPGGTASNIVAFIARGEMGLSILMTTSSTLAATFMTPFITKALAGALVPVNALALFSSTCQVVLAPVVLGTALARTFPVTVARVARVTPCIATLLVAVIVASTLAHSAQAARASGLKLVAAVAALHASGFAVGYWVSRALSLSECICRTNSIEVGMQNSTLGAVLAALHFTDPLVAAPCAVSACTHSIMGSLLAAWWRDRPLEDQA